MPPAAKPASKAPAPPKKGKAPAAPKVPPAKAAVPPGTRVTTRAKFTLYDLFGRPRAHYLVEPTAYDPPAQTAAKPAVAHHVVVVDRSGSMYAAMADTRALLLKLFTLDEYLRSDLVITLISYSSVGDVICHFDRAKVADVVGTASPQRAAVERLQSTGFTCVSQGLKMAAGKVAAGEVTAVTLHSDGYANDPSPSAEVAALTALAEALPAAGGYLNAVAYGPYSDFRLLAKLANLGGGKAVQAGTLKDVYDALYAATKTIGAPALRTVTVPYSLTAVYQTIVSRAAGRVLGGAGELVVPGLPAAADAVSYRYTEVTKAEYDVAPVPEAQAAEAVFAFARGHLAEGNLNTAKYALASTFDKTLLEAHGRALTNPQVAALAAALDAAVLTPTAALVGHAYGTEVVVSKKPSVLEVVRVLDANRAHVLVDRQALVAAYQRRGLKRLVGTRNDDGTVTEPAFKTEFVGEDPFLPVASYDVNRNSASLNMLFARKVRLVPAAGGPPVTEVAGISLDGLSTFNNYTLVGDGELNVPRLEVKISEKRVFETLKGMGVLASAGGPPARYSAGRVYTLRLDDLPVVRPFAGTPDLTGVFADLTALKVLVGVCGAYLKEDAADLTPDQVAELKRHYLSKSLFVNFPTTNPYTSLAQAVADGTVDSRTTYRIDVGTPAVLNLGKFQSPNAFLAKYYAVADTAGAAVDKPRFDHLLDDGVTVRVKPLSAKAKVTAADLLARPLVDAVLGLGPVDPVLALLADVKAHSLAGIIKDRAGGKTPGRATWVAALADAKRRLEDRQEQVFRDRLAPLVMYVGATGVLPDEIAVPALSADALAAKYPDLAIAKDEKEGLFYPVDGDTLLGVTAETVYFSVDPVV